MSWRDVSEIMWDNVKRKPPKFGAGFVPDVSKDQDGKDLSKNSYKGSSDLLGLTFGIGYIDAEENQSNRRITILKLHKIDSEKLGFVARCHETHKVKLFELARITLVTDWVNGEEFSNLEEYFKTTFHSDLKNLLSASFDPFKACRPGLTFLSAIAHSDGRLIEEEIDEIAIYCDQVCRGLGLVLTDKQAEGLRNAVIRFSPDKEAIEESIEHFKNNEAEARLLETHANRLMNADGVQTPEEIALILKFKDVVFS